MLWWRLSRLAIERHLEPHIDTQWGVYDRRPPLIMFVARLASGLLAFLAFLYGLSHSNRQTQQRQQGQYQVPLNAPMLGARAAANYSAGAALAVSSSSSSSSSSATFSFPPATSYFSQPPAPPRSPRYTLDGTRVVAPDGVELVMQHAPGPAPSRGTVLLLHGCAHSARDFFPASAACAPCLGLPEAMRLAQAALLRNYGVLAVSSTERRRACWKANAAAPVGADYDAVATALAVARAAGVVAPLTQDAPLLAVGVSSGGTFATSLAPRFAVAGVISIVAPALIRGVTAAATAPARSAGVSGGLAPHVFTHMNVRDRHTAARVGVSMEQLRVRGAAVAEFGVAPRAVSEHFLVGALDTLDLALAQAVVRSLRRAGVVDNVNQLVEDPRASKWRDVLRDLQTLLNDSFVADRSPLSEELNRAWGAHEITSDFFDEALDFLEANMRSGRRANGTVRLSEAGGGAE